LLSRFCCFFKINVTIYYFYVSSFTKLSFTDIENIYKSLLNMLVSDDFWILPFSTSK
jgi:hypothetical protein